MKILEGFILKRTGRYYERGHLLSTGELTDQELEKAQGLGLVEKTGPKPTATKKPTSRAKRAKE